MEWRDFVTVGVFREVHEAEICRSRLEAAGIRAFIKNEETAYLRHPFIAMAGAWRVEVEVAAKDAELAEAVLAEDLEPVPDWEALEEAQSGEAGLHPPGTAGRMPQPGRHRLPPGERWREAHEAEQEWLREWHSDDEDDPLVVGGDTGLRQLLTIGFVVLAVLFAAWLAQFAF